MTNIEAGGPEAKFISRMQCITCGSENLRTLSQRPFTDEPLLSILRDEPFGESPLPYLRKATWTFVQCGDCEQKFHRDILDDEWIGIYYNRWITSDSIEAYYEKRGMSRFQRDLGAGKHAMERALLLEKMTRKLRGSDPVRVLDFGCGEGAFLATCATLGFEGVGVEFSSAREETKRVSFLNDMEQVGAVYPKSHFHAVTLFEVLEHLARPLDVLRSLHPYVMPGGVLILETPNCEGVTDIKTSRDRSLIDPLGHINGFTPKTQETIAKNAGFRRVVPGVVQCTADMGRVYKREARRFLQPFLKRYTQQVFVKDG